jgi:hypothetical protein
MTMSMSTKSAQAQGRRRAASTSDRRRPNHLRLRSVFMKQLWGKQEERSVMLLLRGGRGLDSSGFAAPRLRKSQRSASSLTGAISAMRRLHHDPTPHIRPNIRGPAHEYRPLRPRFKTRNSFAGSRAAPPH